MTKYFFDMDLVEQKKLKPIFGEKPFRDWKKALT
jgi:hypothetical protein